ncbi:hypothetical protein AVEN_237215-1, partial [Araneus ventricosus]
GRDPGFSCKFYVTSRSIRESIKIPRLDTVDVLIDWNDWRFICSASWKAGELSTIESAVVISDLLTVCESESAITVITSEMLSICVANLYKSYCSCCLCYVFFLHN